MGHALGASHIAHGPREKFGVVLFKRIYQVLDDYLVVGIGEKLGSVPGSVVLFVHAITSYFPRHLPGESYVSLLACLVAAAQQHNHPLLANSVVDAIALTDIDAKFADPASDRTVVPEIAPFNTVKATCDSCLCSLVAQPSQPAQESIAHYYFVSHKGIVSQRIHQANRF